MLNATFQSHPIKMGCCNTNENSLIVITINPIWCSRPVHPGTKTLTFVALKSKENTIFAHIYYRKTNTNQAFHCFFYLSIGFLVKGLDTSNQL